MKGKDIYNIMEMYAPPLQINKKGNVVNYDKTGFVCMYSTKSNFFFTYYHTHCILVLGIN